MLNYILHFVFTVFQISKLAASSIRDCKYLVNEMLLEYDKYASDIFGRWFASSFT
jgi:hypothetical protein